MIASAGFCAIMVGIVCNALLFQKGHHPSPLFASVPAAEAAAPVAAPVAVEPAAPAPMPASPVAAVPDATPDAPASPVPPAVAPAPHRAVHAPTPHHQSAKPAKPAGDGITRLLDGSPPRKPVPASTTPARPAVQVHASAKPGAHPSPLATKTAVKTGSATVN